MPLPPPPSLDALTEALVPLCRGGAQPTALIGAQATKLLDLITDPTQPIHIRADLAHRMLVTAAGKLPAADGDTAVLLLHLGDTQPADRPPLLMVRRRIAARRYGRTPETFRKYQQHKVLTALAMQLARDHAGRLRAERRHHAPRPPAPSGPILLTKPSAPRHLGPTAPDTGPTTPPPRWPPR